MTHHEIENQDIIERYVRHQLPAAARRAFQEHYFACEECFAQVQMTAQFVAGIQHSSRVGTLAESTRELAGVSAWSWRASWFKPAFALAATACLLLAVALGWLVFRQLPQLQAELAQERQAREELARRNEQSLQTTKDELEQERQRAAHEKAEREKLAAQLAQATRPQPAPDARPQGDVQANVPIVILESTRDSSAGTKFKLPANATALTLWIEVEAGDRFESFQMQLFAANGRGVKTISGLKANAYGALAARVATQQLPAGKYLVKLFGLKQQQKELVGEYNLTLHS
jgi:hypothetical protein